MSKKTIISASDDLILKLKVLATEKEEVRRKLAITAKELAATATEKEKVLIATLNVLEDLQIEREKLARDKAKDEALLASIGDGVVAVDEDGKIALMNHAAEQMLGWSANQAMGKLLIDVWKVFDEKGNQISETERPIISALRGITTTTTTGPSYFYIRKDGVRFPVAITVTPIVVENRIVGAVDVFRNIARDKEIDRAKTEFVSLASHQLKTPPTAIKLLIERILNGKVGPLTEKQKEYFNDIQSSNQRMIDIINALLSVSRIEMGTFAIEPKRKNICALVRNILNELKFAINNKKVRLEQTLPKNSLTVSIDESLFRMVINNLIMNAVNYTQEGGKIHVSCKQVNKGTTFYVAIPMTGMNPVRSKTPEATADVQALRTSNGVKANTGKK